MFQTCVSPARRNAAADDTLPAASASVAVAYAAVAVASGGSAAWPDTAKRKQKKCSLSLRKLLYNFNLTHAHWCI